MSVDARLTSVLTADEYLRERRIFLLIGLHQWIVIRRMGFDRRESWRVALTRCIVENG